MTICPVPTAAALHTQRLLTHSPHSSTVHCSFSFPFVIWKSMQSRSVRTYSALSWAKQLAVWIKTEPSRWKSEAFKIKRTATKCSISRGQTSCGRRSQTSRQIPSLGHSPDPARVDSLMLGEKYHQVWVIHPVLSTRVQQASQPLWARFKASEKGAKPFPFHPSWKEAMQLSAWVHRQAFAFCLAMRTPGSQPSLPVQGEAWSSQPHPVRQTSLDT